MIRILHSVSNMDRAGIETMLMNYYRRIDRSQIQFDFLVNKPKPGDYDDEIRSLGGNIYVSPGLAPWKFPAYMRFMKELLRAHPDIKILHAHNEGMMEYALKGAKSAGMPVRIAHAHNTRIIHDYKWPLKVFCKQFIPHTATEYFGYGRDAGIYYFGKKRWAEKGVIFYARWFRYNPRTVTLTDTPLYIYTLGRGGSAIGSFHPERVEENFFLSETIESVVREWGLYDSPMHFETLCYCYVRDLQLSIKNISLSPMPMKERTAWLKNIMRDPRLKTAVRTVPLSRILSRNDKIKLSLLKRGMYGAVMRVSGLNNR